MLRRASLALLLAATAGCTATSAHPSAGGSGVDPTRLPVVATVPWEVTHAGAPDAIEGFASRTSVLAGQPVDLYVSTGAPSYRVSAFRMGWYGGAQGGLVWRSGALPGRRQPAARLLPRTSTVVAPWRRSVTVETRGFPPGDYLLRLDASTGAQRFVPLTVRSGSAAGKVVIVNAVATWEAYNRWGGYDLYEGEAGDFAGRSRVVSFDRPYQQGFGSGQFTTRELPLVSLAERLGLPLEYVTDVDLQEQPDLLRGARAVITLGHSEYWSPAMRRSIVRARDAGTNLAFLGANAVFRRIRFEPSALGPDRLEVDYKVASEDPLVSTGGESVTADWDAPPSPQPATSLVGTTYDCSRTPASDMVVVDPGSWLFAGTGARVGTRLPRVVGTEADRVELSNLGAPNLEVLAHSPYRCAGRSTWSDMTYYSAPSGAGVFSTGTITWVCVLGSSCKGYGGGDAKPVLTRVTTNLLLAFAAGPAGRAHPSQANAARVVGR